MAKTKILICPYCGAGQPAADKCRACRGLFEPLSRQATLNAMGPWFIRDAERPFQPGCSYETLVRMVDRGKITKTSIVRGPTTRQLWAVARRVNGVAHLLGYCHACDASVDPGDHACHACGAAFGAYLDRNYLGLPEIRPLPWEADVDDERRRSGGGSMGGRLSRFASDEELLDPDSSRTGVTAFAAADPAPRGAGGGGGAGEALAEYASTTVTRSLQRRVASQARANRLLAGFLAVAVVVAVATNFGPLAQRLSAPPPAAPAPPARPGAPAAAASAPIAPPEASTREPQAGSEPPAPAPVEPAAAPEPAPGAAPAALEEARQLIDAAARADRAIDERIADCERALQLLQTIESAAAGELAREAQAQLDRLTLKRDYFDPPEE